MIKRESDIARYKLKYMFTNIFLPLAITLLFETIIYMILKPKNLKLFIVVSILNIILNITMNSILFFINEEWLYWLVLFSYEIFTTLIEALIIFKLIKIKFSKTLLAAISANLFSFIIGFSLHFIYENKIAALFVSWLFLILYFIYFGYIFYYFLVKNYKNKL